MPLSLNTKNAKIAQIQVYAAVFLSNFESVSDKYETVIAKKYFLLKYLERALWISNIYIYIVAIVTVAMVTFTMVILAKITSTVLLW